MSADVIQFRCAGAAGPAAGQNELAGAAGPAAGQNELAGAAGPAAAQDELAGAAGPAAAQDELARSGPLPHGAHSAHLHEPPASPVAAKPPLQPFTLRELMAIAFSSETWD